MTRIPIESLANGVIYSTVPFVSPQNPTGAPMLTPAAGAVVEVYVHDTTTPATVWSQESGGSTLALPLATGPDGSVPGWVDPTTLPLDLVVNGRVYVLASSAANAGTVASVSAGDGTITIGGTSVAPTVKVTPSTFDAAGTASSLVAAETSRAEAAEALLAPLASPALTGTPTAPTPTNGDSSTKIATTAFVTGAAVPGGPPVAYRIVAPGGGDDTANIKAAIAAVVTAGQANGTNVGEVWFDTSKGPFTIHGALDKTAGGNAQIALPNIGTDKPKFILRFRFGGGGAPVWDQSRLLESGGVFISNLNLGYDATYGVPSVLGGPTHEQVGSSYSSNLLFVIDGGLTVITPANYISYAVDFQNVAMVRIGALGLNGSVNPATISSLPTAGGAGLRMPLYWSESFSEIDRLIIMGHSYGCVPGGNTLIHNAYIVYCQYAVAPASGQLHAARFDYLKTDACQYHLTSQITGAATRIDIGLWDTEDATGFAATTYHVDDNSNFLRGNAAWHNFSNASGQQGAGPTVHGGSGLRLINYTQSGGHVTAPGVPSSTVALQNPFWRDAAVTVTGGTVTAIAVDGVATGLTSGTVIVPSGKTITLTYTGSPNWNWVLL
ncbi:MAG: hypothetical protein ACXVXP_00545 [Mycobacteriaceae bacterium]